MSKSECETILSQFEDVTKLRYIVLTSKTTKLTNIKDKTMIPYVKPMIHNLVTYCGMKTKLLTIPFNSGMVNNCKSIIKNLICSPINSFSGINIVADNPDCNDVMLNVTRPHHIPEINWYHLLKFITNNALIILSLMFFGFPINEYLALSINLHVENNFYNKSVPWF